MSYIFWVISSIYQQYPCTWNTSHIIVAQQQQCFKKLLSSASWTCTSICVYVCRISISCLKVPLLLLLFLNQICPSTDLGPPLFLTVGLFSCMILYHDCMSVCPARTCSLTSDPFPFKEFPGFFQQYWMSVISSSLESTASKYQLISYTSTFKHTHICKGRYQAKTYSSWPKSCWFQMTHSWLPPYAPRTESNVTMSTLLLASHLVLPQSVSQAQQASKVPPACS